MTVLAIDPGFGRCGVAVLEGSGTKAALLYSSCIETKTNDEFSERLLFVANEIIRLIGEYKPETIALEEIYFTNNARTAIHVAEIRGMLIYLAASHNIPLVEFNPLAIKIAITGYGRASKEQVTKMVGKLVTLPRKKMLDDEYDAIAVGLTALAQSKYKK
ncbi:MAG: crossover junction endodeoxyribonuclease RuvC [Candidatus Lloydbacteria bacterium RIFCSPLOWO2_01_FULL_50_20]|uniref:Crossover junction endodeoxyribonuclease RuvC n=1 Tax=Candidatus Lloydbacteria bacterium RIFCSPLOWO2_01_FULL_50_20 TaxID=1798665 RepID=A0A1G2DIM7_9BACT|nr:MAG: crossover junction endodeoxyribonuclease RuvC [Candidatus Lloydbacteria bacterium RIFCSPHIGHO2_02_FULL_50_11]OGZ12811.1 MAG: crossover junction endodeoxyribonuclease RuvC [Candidatus Lloydbacteria bacterium RIFCSPLOWO2_01_FULL_50_20]